MNTPLAPSLEAFFTDRLLCQQQVSPNTIASYRDTFRLLLTFAQQSTGTRPARLELTQLDAPTIGAFLEHLETQRGNSARTVTSYSSVIECVFGFVGRHASVSSAVRGAA
jgi:site-specific recombinase XerC